MAGRVGSSRTALGTALALCLLARGALAVPTAPATPVSVLLVDAAGNPVDAGSSHASITRTLPEELLDDSSGASDPDALRWVFAGPGAALPTSADFVSFAADGSELDVNHAVPLAASACPPGVPVSSACVASPALRLTVDAVDRAHPLARARSLQAEVGGTVRVRAGGSELSVRVGGPRRTALGPIERLRGRLRVRVLRSFAGGPPAIGKDDAEALALARREVRQASRVWGQCGIHFGLDSELDVRVVDPPAPYMVAVGCDAGLPASGGSVRVVVDGRAVEVPSEAGDTPRVVAARLARAWAALGLEVAVSPNLRTASGAQGAVDVIARRRDGRLARVSNDGVSPLSTDPTLTVCLGEVDLGDGLVHFGDSDAAAGTVEERSLIRAFDDRDPSTIEVLVIPSFDRSGRIGESFINGDGAGIRNTVLIDRTAVESGARSFALAHELGHVLLNMPGHPDDYGVDQPSMLMDADAADPTIFGPRRLSLAECERALRESGPRAPVPLLRPWPLTSPAAPPRAERSKQRLTPVR